MNRVDVVDLVVDLVDVDLDADLVDADLEVDLVFALPAVFEVFGSPLFQLYLGPPCRHTIILLWGDSNRFPFIFNYRSMPKIN